MHDIAADAIQFSSDILLKMTNLLKNKPDIMLGDDNSLYKAGIFIGKNLLYFISESDSFLLPETFGVLIKRGEELLLKMNELAKVSKSIDDRFKKSAVEILNKYKDPFGEGLGYGLAQAVPSFDQQDREEIWRRLRLLLNKNIALVLVKALPRSFLS
jgi:hypothetical protein